MSANEPRLTIEEYDTLNGQTFVACCSCGWRSSRHETKSSAIGSAHWHAGECPPFVDPTGTFCEHGHHFQDPEPCAACWADTTPTSPEVAS